MRHQISAAAIAAILSLGDVCTAYAAPPTGSSQPKEQSGKSMAPNPPISVAAASVNRFGLTLFKDCAKSSQDKNLFLSPTSVYLALSIACNGAGGSTATAIAKTLQFAGEGQDVAAANTANAALLTSLAAPDPKVTLSIANAVWADHSTHFAPEFAERVKAIYAGEVSTLNFRSPEAAAAINAWAAKNTHGKITRVVTPSDLRDSADAVLTDAIYFKGLWSQPFAKERTEEAPFHRVAAAGGDKMTPMMQGNIHAGFLHSDAFDAVRLPYGEGRFALYAFLPSTASNIDTFVADLTPENWQLWQKALSLPENGTVEVHLPRFKVSYEASLKKPLADLGMEIAFSHGADFRPMGLAHSVIGDVRHKAVLEVNEEGSEAAAVTTVIMSRSAAFRRPRIIVFDRPFFCAICDDQTGALLFMGAVNDPE